MEGGDDGTTMWMYLIVLDWSLENHKFCVIYILPNKKREIDQNYSFSHSGGCVLILLVVLICISLALNINDLKHLFTSVCECSVAQSGLFVTLLAVACQAPLFVYSPGKNTGMGCISFFRGSSWSRDLFISKFLFGFFVYEVSKSFAHFYFFFESRYTSYNKIHYF